jgi:hypothetical protein
MKLKIYTKRGNHTRSSTTGQAALSLTFLIGGIAVLVAVTLAFLALTFINAGFGYEAAQRALAIASGGAQDALMQLSRNYNFANASGYCIPDQSLPCGSGAATVTVSQNSPSSGQATITSTGRSSLYARRIQVVVSVAATTGKVNVISWKLVSL